MKKITLLSTAIFFIGFFIACNNDDYEVNETAPAQVANLASAAGLGEVYLTWETPNDPNLVYMRVSYVNEKGDVVNKLVDNNNINPITRITKDTICGLINVPMTFSVYTCTVRGTNQGGIDVNQTPETPAFLDLIKTISLEEDFGGVNVSWANDFYRDATIVLNYASSADPDVKGKTTITAKGHEKATQFIALTTDEGKVMQGNECTVIVTVEDSEGHQSDAKTVNLTPLEVIKFAKSDWSFPGYVDDDGGATIGYTSQEAGGEGKTPNGRVIAMIDDNLSTFWSARWTAPGGAYPQWFIIDLGKEVKISNIELARRQGDNRGAIWHQFFTCPESGAVDKKNPKTWNWIDEGTYDFNKDIDDFQNYRIKSNPVARYIKVYFGEEQGTSSLVMVSEINIYGVEK